MSEGQYQFVTFDAGCILTNAAVAQDLGGGSDECDLISGLLQQLLYLAHDDDMACSVGLDGRSQLFRGFEEKECDRVHHPFLSVDRLISATDEADQPQFKKWHGCDDHDGCAQW